MNTAHSQDCSVSKKVVMDCKFTSPGLMFFACFFALPERYRLFSHSSNAPAECGDKLTRSPLRSKAWITGTLARDALGENT